MIENRIMIWDLQEIVEELTDHYPIINQVYLFGSRAYQTNSLRSDIDLLAITNGEALIDSEINSWLPHKYSPVDLFWTYDGIVARSSANGSIISFRKDDLRKYKDLPEQLDAIVLWDKEHGFYEGTHLKQRALRDISFPMSVIPSKAEDDPAKTMDNAIQRIEESGVNTFFAGSTIDEISKTIIDILQIGMEKPKRFQEKAKSFSYNTIKLTNEYDFHNYIHFLLRPIFKDIEWEPVMVIIDGNSKKADFGLNRNQIIIEAKWIDSTTKKAEVLKTLDGLKSFYGENPQVRSLIFLILYSSTVEIDEVVLTDRFTQEYSNPPIFIRFISNTYEESED